jgi:hypothetical protein
MNKKLFWIVMLFLLSAGTFSEAQQPKKIPRIGFVSVSGDANNQRPQVEAFRQGLRDLGYGEGKNILVEYRYIEGRQDRVPALWANWCNSKSMSLSL